MDRRPLMTVVAGASLAVAALAGVAALAPGASAPDGAATVFVPGVIARLDVRRDTGVAGAAGVGAVAAGGGVAAPSSTVALPPLPSNTGPNATYDAPFVAPDDPLEPSSTVVDPDVPIIGVLDTVSVVDDLAMITVELPSSWSAVDTAPAGTNPALAASPDWDRWAEWQVPGVVIVAYPTIVDPEGALSADPLTERCRAGAISRFTERDHHGVQQVFTDCGGDHRVTNYVWIVSPADLAYSLYVNVQLVGAGDRGAFEVIRSTFDTVAGAVLPADATPAPTAPLADPAPESTVPAPPVPSAPASTTIPPATVPATTAPAATIPAGYVAIRDNTGTLELVVPATWAQTNGASTRLDSGAWAPTLAASTDLRGLQARYDVPGVYVSRVELLGEPARLLARYAAGLDRDCAGSAGAESFATARFSGLQQRWDDCGGTGYQFVVIVASPLVVDQAADAPDDQAGDAPTLAMFVQLPAGETYTLDVLTESLTLRDAR